MSTPTSSHRKTLPPTHTSVTHKFSVGGHEGYLTIGLFDDGTPGEIFIKMSKEGSTLSGLIQGFCRAFSLAIQYGLPLPDAVRDLVNDGLELGTANDRVFSKVNSKQKGGAFGLLTNGRMTRESVYAQSISIALIPFVHESFSSTVKQYE